MEWKSGKAEDDKLKDKCKNKVKELRAKLQHEFEAKGGQEFDEDGPWVRQIQEYSDKYKEEYMEARPRAESESRAAFAKRVQTAVDQSVTSFMAENFDDSFETFCVSRYKDAAHDAWKLLYKEALERRAAREARSEKKTELKAKRAKKVV